MPLPRTRRFIARNIRALAAAAAMTLVSGCAIRTGQDFSTSALPPDQVATVTSDSLQLGKVDGTQNVPSLHDFFSFGHRPLSAIQIAPGMHTIEVDYWTGPRSVQLQPVRVALAASRHYTLEMKDGQVKFSEIIGGLTRNIPLYHQMLSSDNTPAPRTTVIINVQRPATPASQNTGGMTTVQAAAPDAATLYRPAMTFDQWSKQHPDTSAAGAN